MCHIPRYFKYHRLLIFHYDVILQHIGKSSSSIYERALSTACTLKSFEALAEASSSQLVNKVNQEMSNK